MPRSVDVMWCLGVVCAALCVYAIAEQCQTPDLNIVQAPSLRIMYTMKSLNILRCQRACAYTLGCQKVAYNTTKKICHFLGNGSREIPADSVLEYANKTYLEPSHPCISSPCGENSICSPRYISDTGYRCIPFDRTDGSCYTEYVGYNTVGTFGSQFHMAHPTTKLVNHTEAKQICTCLGGHLVVVENEVMWKALKAFMELHVIAHLWIDGEREPTGPTTPWTHWNGRSLMYSTPGARMSGTLDFCVRLRQNEGYGFSDYRCYMLANVVCQNGSIDITVVELRTSGQVRRMTSSTETMDI